MSHPGSENMFLLTKFFIFDIFRLSTVTRSKTKPRLTCGNRTRLSLRTTSSWKQRILFQNSKILFSNHFYDNKHMRFPYYFNFVMVLCAQGCERVLLSSIGSSSRSSRRCRTPPAPRVLNRKRFEISSTFCI